MDSISIGLFVLVGVGFVFVVVNLLDSRRAVAELQRFVPEALAKAITPDARVTALELENRTIKADITEIKAIRRTEVERARQAQSRPASFKAFRNQIKGTEIEP